MVGSSESLRFAGIIASCLVAIALASSCTSKPQDKSLLPHELVGKKFSSCDGLEKLDISNDKAAELRIAGRLIPTTIGKDGSTTTVKFKEMNDVLQDSNGTILYPEGAIELLTAEKMRLAIKAVQACLKTCGRLPDTVTTVKFYEPTLQFVSPITNRMTEVSFLILSSDEAGMRASRSQSASFAGYLQKFPKPVTANFNEQPPDATPGQIEIVAIRSPPGVSTFTGSNGRIVEIYVRGYDRNKCLLTSSKSDGSIVLMTTERGQSEEPLPFRLQSLRDASVVNVFVDNAP
jgi:hypothetical protein